jgi:hypothetical protein
MGPKILFVAIAFAGTVIGIAACGGSNGGVVPGPAGTPPFNKSTPTPSPTPKHASAKHASEPR